MSAHVATAASPDLIILNGFLVFFMQVGFVTLETGYGRAKNVRNILLKNTVDVLLAALAWWALGFAFAYGESAAGFIGSSNFFEDSSEPQSKPWFFSWTFAVSTATIVSGCLAERTALTTYPVFTLALCAWVHPLAAHWVWNSNGWLQSVSRCHFLDFAGGSVVHAIGGVTGLVGAYFCGPRLGRFDAEEGSEGKAIPGHDTASVAIGTFMLWFGWFGFNAGSVYVYNLSAGYIVDRVAMCMTLCAAASGLTSMLLHSFKTGTFDLCIACNGLLTGLVAATGTCAYVPSWGAVAIGCAAGALYVSLSRMLVRLKIDDPLDSSVIHLGGGLLGVVLNGALAKPSYVALLHAGDSNQWSCGGFILSRGDGGMQLGMQLLGAVVITSWAFLWACLVFWLLWRAGRLRVDQATELAGLDNMEHGGPAYPEFNLVMAPYGAMRA